MNDHDATTYKLLDHGYLKIIETWGRDSAIIEAARMSTDKGFLGWDAEWHYQCDRCIYSMVTTYAISAMTCKACSEGMMKRDEKKTHKGDAKLLKFLYEHKHFTPFEMAGATIEVQAPIFVFREWHRHRTQSYNELSARYTPLPDVNYLPTVERCLIVNATNKQAGKIATADTLDEQSTKQWLSSVMDAYEIAERVYQDGLRRGIPKEVARCVVPVGRYSRMRASANLRNWMGFLSLRTDENAQWEIRQFADQLAKALSKEFPRTMHLWKAKP